MSKGLGDCVNGFNAFVASIFAIVLTYQAVKYDTYRDFSPGVSLMLTITGYMSSAVSILGGILDIIAACCEVAAIRIFKVIISVILILTLLAAAIACIVLINRDFEQNVRDALEGYKIKPEEVRIWDHVQQDFGCCGINNWTDWIGQGDLDNNSLPDSCCYLHTMGCGQGIVPNISMTLNTDLTIFTKSCTDAGFFDFTYPWVYAIAGVSIFMNVLNIIGVIASGEDGEAFEF